MSTHIVRQNALDGGISFLRDRQEPSGEFAIQLWRDEKQPTARMRDHAVTVAAFVLYALYHLNENHAGEIARRAISFLAREMRPPGVWTYWTRDSGKTIHPDLDDTAMISFVLRRHHPHIALGSNVEVLLAARDDRGRFYTWFRPSSLPNDVDAVVNANVVLYLGERPETASARAYLVECLVRGLEAESYWYYLDDAALHYAISRAMWHGIRSLEPVREVLVRRALARQCTDGSFGDELATAWTACTLVNVENDRREAESAAVEFLLARQLPHGGWPCVAACTGPEPPGPRNVYWGSEELTTAACLEALARSR